MSKTVNLTPEDDRPPAPTVDPDISGADLIDRDPTPADGQTFSVGPALDTDLEAIEPMTEAEMADKIRTVTTIVNLVAPTADDPELWDLTPEEMASIAPQLTRILNKRPRLVAAVQRTDELSLAVGLGRYAIKRVAYLRAYDAEEHAPEGTEQEFGLDGDIGPEVYPNA